MHEDPTPLSQLGGPIGSLLVAAARYHGALRITATDVLDGPLERAGAVGADRVVNVAKDPDALGAGNGPKGQFDVMFEASGNEAAIRAGLEWLKPRGVMMQVGVGGEVQVPQTLIVAKEIEVRGSFRFHEEFAWAARLLGSGRLPVESLVSDVVPVDRAVEAFQVASDRERAMKVQIAF